MLHSLLEIVEKKHGLQLGYEKSIPWASPVPTRLMEHASSLAPKTIPSVYGMQIAGSQLDSCSRVTLGVSALSPALLTAHSLSPDLTTGPSASGMHRVASQSGGTQLNPQFMDK
jgi:hypothetical protein